VKQAWGVVLVTVGGLLLGACAPSGQRLETIRAKGFVTCGIWTGIAGFATVDAQGRYAGIDVDVCRAVSAAIFGTPDKVKYVTAENVRQLRQSDDIDIVSRRITWSLTRATANGLMFGPVVFYDGQGFLIPKTLGITAVSQLAGAPICVQSDEAHASTLTGFLKNKDIAFTAVAVENNQQVETAFREDRCKAYSADLSLLGAARAAMLEPEDFDILPDLISKEPLAPIVREGDDQFFEIVRWSIFAMIDAEERGLTSQNVDKAIKSDLPDTQRFLGVIPGNGAALGLEEQWAYTIIKTVGNYGEMFDRNVGRTSSIKLERGLNKLWTDGGLMYAPRLR
jgi:general L-amino acid transport system substrate-binding protein